MILLPNASHTSGSAKIVLYQCKVKDSRGIVGNLAELNEKITLKTIGANTKMNNNTT